MIRVTESSTMTWISCEAWLACQLSTIVRQLLCADHRLLMTSIRLCTTQYDVAKALNLL